MGFKNSAWKFFFINPNYKIFTVTFLYAENSLSFWCPFVLYSAEDWAPSCRKYRMIPKTINKSSSTECNSSEKNLMQRLMLYARVRNTCTGYLQEHLPIFIYSVK